MNKQKKTCMSYNIMNIHKHCVKRCGNSSEYVYNKNNTGNGDWGLPSGGD